MDGDLAVGSQFWLDLLALRTQGDFPIVSANLELNGQRLFPAHVVLERGGRKIFVTSYVSPEQNELSEVGLIAKAEPDWQDLRRELETAAPDNKANLVVIATGSIQEIVAMVEGGGLRDLCSEILVVLAGHSDLPVVELNEAGLLAVEVGQKGRDIAWTSWPMIRDFQHFSLTARYGSNSQASTILDFYRANVKAEQLFFYSPRFDAAEGSYAGSEACALCHSKAYEVWKNSKHAQAWQTLVATNDMADPECLPCHVVDYDRQGGFDPATSQPVNVQCEACHGPALAHVEKQEATPRGKLDRGLCLKCHDLENSPQFDYEKYWPKVAHGK